MSISKSLNDFYKKQGRLVGADGNTIHTMSFGEIIKPEDYIEENDLATRYAGDDFTLSNWDGFVDWWTISDYETQEKDTWLETLFGKNQLTDFVDINSGVEEQPGENNITISSCINSAYFILCFKAISNFIEFVESRVEDCQNLNSLIEGYDFCFHLAAGVGVQYIMENVSKALLTNIEGTHKVFEACKENDIQRDFFSSSACAYNKDLQNMEILNMSTLS